MNDPRESTRIAEQTAPLSFAQQRLWLLDRLIATGAVYNNELVLRLAGELDVAALRGAFNELVRRHEVLRTRFGMQDGQPVQVIAPELALALPIDDLEHYAPDARAPEAQRRAQAEAAAPFDLERGPLIRARLLRLARAEHWLLLTLHHIVTDGWSNGVLTRELTALYGALHRGEASPLPVLPVQYADYAVWQRQWLQGPVLERQLTHWRQVLSDLPALDLPSDRPRPAIASHLGGKVRLEIPEPLTRALKALSRREGATLFMTLLAAYQILLARHSGQDDIAVGVPTAGRTRPQLEGLIGFFVNTLVLRGDLSGRGSFRSYLAQARDRALDAFSHQDLPFEKLVEELAPKRDLSRNPLFQASLALQNTPPGHWKLPDLEVQRLEHIHNGSAKFDLTLHLSERDGMLAGSLEFATDLFDSATIERMATHFVRLLEEVVADPDCRIDELPLLTAAERHRLLVECNRTEAGDPDGRCIHQLFEEHAARRPDAVAAVFEDGQLTYGELDARANRLAHHLRSLGVGPDVLVGLCVERGLELLVGLLGILKAGGAYVPLDPDLPRERLAFMLDDAAVPILVTQHALLDRLPAHAKTVCLDRDQARFAAHGAAAPTSGPRTRDLAYVMYTSGSTGKPKGVMVTHGNVRRLFSATRRWFHFTDNDVWTCFHSCAFDFSVWEIWGALAHGGRLVMVPYLVSRDPDAFHALLRREHVTVLNQTPSAFRQFAEADARAVDATDLRLRLVILGGEALAIRSLRSWFGRHGDTAPQLVNMYGITETTVHVTCRPLRCADVDDARGSMIGERIPDLRLHVLDRHLQPVPVGVAGEIVVGGAGVARGYLNRPELTAERFVADSFSGDGQARLYRSGDLARRTPSGDLEFLGRIDQQVKLRGFRIEPGEIEAVLARHEHVGEAAVVLRDDVPGDPRLVAYVVARTEALAAADLREWLRRQLPEYMVPAAFVLLPALPLTANGKLNTKALPAPDVAPQGPTRELPATPIESIIAQIWAAVLDVAHPGIDDDFFDLGGHSMLAVLLINRINEALHVDLTLRQLFAAPTIRALALAALDSMVAGADENGTPRSEEVR